MPSNRRFESRGRYGRQGLSAVLVLTALFALRGAIPDCRAGDREALDLYGQAIEDFNQGRFPQARKRINEALRERPKSGAKVRPYGVRIESYYPYFWLGRIYLEEGDVEKAVEQLTREEHEGEIQKDKKGLYAQLQRYLDQAKKRLPEKGDREAPATLAKAKEALGRLDRFESEKGGSLTKEQRGRLEKARADLNGSTAKNDAPAMEHSASAAGELVTTLQSELAAAAARESGPAVVKSRAVAVLGKIGDLEKDKSAKLTAEQRQKLQRARFNLNGAIAQNDARAMEGASTDAAALIATLQPGTRAAEAVVPPEAKAKEGAVDLAAVRSKATEGLKKVKDFEKERAGSLREDQRQRLAKARSEIEKSLQKEDGAALSRAASNASAEIAAVRKELEAPAPTSTLAEATSASSHLLERRRTLLSSSDERVLRDLLARVQQAQTRNDRSQLKSLEAQLRSRNDEASAKVEKAASAVKAAYEQVAAGRHQSAIDGLESALRAQPDSAGLQIVLASFYFSLAQHTRPVDAKKVEKAKSLLAGVYRAHKDVSLPDRYFSPRFIAMAREVRP